MSKTFPTFGIKFSTKLSTLSSSCSDEHYVENKNRILKIVLFQNLRIFFNLSTIFPQNWQNCFLSVETNNLMENYFLKNSSSICLRLWAKRFRQRKFAKLSNLVPTCSGDHSDEKRSILKVVFFFVIWAIFSLTFVKKYSATLAEGPSKRLDEHFDVQQFLLKKCSFFGFWSKLFLNFCILFLQICEKCFLRTDANTSIKKIFFENFSSFFGIGSKHFLILGKNFTERLSELLSTFSKTSWRNRLFHFFSLFVV